MQMKMKQMRVLFLACAVGLLGALTGVGAAFANSKDGKCSFDSDCRGAKCRSGKCADAAGGSCAFDSDCGGGKCRSGKCANAPDGTCAFDSDCGGGRKCSSSKCK